MTATANDYITSLQQRFKLSYHVNYAFHAEALVGLRGKRVLEVGGSLPREFVGEVLGAQAWVALEETDYWTETLSTGHIQGTPPSLQQKMQRFAEASRADIDSYKLFFGRIEDLPAALTGHFDVVFSIAAFEHIARLPLALEKMWQALRPGGKLFAMFAPLWSSYNGHHLPEIVDHSGQQWNFGNSPIPPWGHLLFRPMELYDLLLTKCDSATAREIVYFVYSSPHINRLFLNDYLEILSRSWFKVIESTPLFPSEVPPVVQQQLSLRYPGRHDFSHSGLLFVLER